MSAGSRMRIGAFLFSGSISCGALDPPSADLRQLVVLGNGLRVTDSEAKRPSGGLRRRRLFMGRLTPGQRAGVPSQAVRPSARPVMGPSVGFTPDVGQAWAPWEKVPKSCCIFW
jgi:hypothetical protein